MLSDESPLEALAAEKRAEWQKRLAERIYERAIAACITHAVCLSANYAEAVAESADLAAKIWCANQERQ